MDDGIFNGLSFMGGRDNSHQWFFPLQRNPPLFLIDSGKTTFIFLYVIALIYLLL
jgi:hypothetical protein